MQALKLFLVLPLLFTLHQDLKIEPTKREGYNSITANDLRAHLNFLASSELEGRETSFRGQKVAARYIAAVFEKLGLHPVGDNGTYFQYFDLEVTKPGKQSTLTVAGKGTTNSYSMLKDFVTTFMQDTLLTAHVVFIGFSDARPDSAALAVAEGKIALVLARVPQKPADVRRLGGYVVPRSAATILVTDEPSTGTIEEIVQRAGTIFTKGQMRLPGTAPTRGGGIPMLTVSSEVGNEILKAARTSLAQLRNSAEPPKPFVIPGLTVTIETRVERSIVPSENVVGLLEGSDPKLKNEVLVITAHYDHVGIGNDGAIYFGADDNGSGTSLILELAEAYVKNPAKPTRSILFMALSGEEKGLLGSRYYVENPIFPLDKTIANLNIDMVGRTDKKWQEKGSSNYVYVIGSDKISTELDSLVRVANERSERFELDYQYNDDNDPNQFYRRSDHFNFARNGIPIAFFFTGVHDDYHRPTDTVDKIQFDRLARVGRLIYTLGWKVTDFPRQFRKDGSSTVYQ